MRRTRKRPKVKPLGTNAKHFGGWGTFHSQGALRGCRNSRTERNSCGGDCVGGCGEGWMKRRTEGLSGGDGPSRKILRSRERRLR